MQYCNNANNIFSHFWASRHLDYARRVFAGKYCNPVLMEAAEMFTKLSFRCGDEWIFSEFSFLGGMFIKDFIGCRKMMTVIYVLLRVQMLRTLHPHHIPWRLSTVCSQIRHIGSKALIQPDLVPPAQSHQVSKPLNQTWYLLFHSLINMEIIQQMLHKDISPCVLVHEQWWWQWSLYFCWRTSPGHREGSFLCTLPTPNSPLLQNRSLAEQFDLWGRTGLMLVKEGKWKVLSMQLTTCNQCKPGGKVGVFFWDFVTL